MMLEPEDIEADREAIAAEEDLCEMVDAEQDLEDSMGPREDGI